MESSKSETGLQTDQKNPAGQSSARTHNGSAAKASRRNKSSSGSGGRCSIGERMLR
jgi:hypothetical protein